MDNFARMRAFVAVVDAGGFSAAGRRDGRSKALLSKHVAELEERLGIRLINRTSRKFSLTEAGRSYHREAADILARVDALEEAVREAHLGPRGHLRVAAPRTLGDGIVSRLVMAFLEREADITIELSLEDRFVDIVEEGFDVAIRVAELADSSLIARRLAPFRMVVCARPDVAAAARVARPADLSERPCIVDTNTRTRRNWPFAEDGERTTVQVAGRVEANSPMATREAALAGIGYARIPHAVVAGDLAAGRLVAVLEAFEPGTSAVWAVYPHRRHLSGKVRAFVDFLVERFPAAIAGATADPDAPPGGVGAAP